MKTTKQMQHEIGLQDEVETERPKYLIGRNGQGERFFFCIKCRLRSYNENDIDHRYCVACHQFHNDE